MAARSEWLYRATSAASVEASEAGDLERVSSNLRTAWFEFLGFEFLHFFGGDSAGFPSFMFFKASSMFVFVCLYFFCA